MRVGDWGEGKDATRFTPLALHGLKVGDGVVSRRKTGTVAEDGDGRWAGENTRPHSNAVNATTTTHGRTAVGAGGSRRVRGSLRPQLPPGSATSTQGDLVGASLPL